MLSGEHLLLILTVISTIVAETMRRRMVTLRADIEFRRKAFEAQQLEKQQRHEEELRERERQYEREKSLREQQSAELAAKRDAEMQELKAKTDQTNALLGTINQLNFTVQESLTRRDEAVDATRQNTMALNNLAHQFTVVSTNIDDLAERSRLLFAQSSHLNDQAKATVEFSRNEIKDAVTAMHNSREAIQRAETTMRGAMAKLETLINRAEVLPKELREQIDTGIHDMQTAIRTVLLDLKIPLKLIEPGEGGFGYDEYVDNHAV